MRPAWLPLWVTKRKPINPFCGRASEPQISPETGQRLDASNRSLPAFRLEVDAFAELYVCSKSFVAMCVRRGEAGTERYPVKGSITEPDLMRQVVPGHNWSVCFATTPCQDACFAIEGTATIDSISER